VRLWDPNSPCELLNKPLWGMLYPRFSRAGYLLGCSTRPTTIGVLEAVGGLGYRTLARPRQGDRICDFSPDGRLLAVTDSNALHLLDSASGKELAELPNVPWDPSQIGHFTAFHPKSTNLFQATGKGVEEWSLNRSTSDGQLSLALNRRLITGTSVSRLALSRDGNTLAAWGSDTLYFWDVPTEAMVHRLPLSSDARLGTLSPDAHLVACWARVSTNVQIWNPAHSNLVQVLPAHPSLFAAFSPDTRWLAVGDEVEYRLWDVATWQTLYALPRQAAGFWAFLAFSPDGSMLALAISRTTVRLIEAATGRELAALEAPERKDIHWITFNPDGTQLAVATGPGPIQLWELSTVRRQLASMNLDWQIASPPEQDPNSEADFD
jgi:WD40 repeat protein